MTTKIIFIVLIISFITWVIYLNTNHEDVLEESLALQRHKDSLAKIVKDIPPPKPIKSRIDEKEKVISFEYKENLAIATYKTKFSFVNRQKIPIADFKYYAVDNFSEGLAAVSINHKWGFINSQGKEVIQLEYGAVMHFSEGIAGFKVGDFWGFMDRKGKVRIAPQYETISPFKSGKAQVSIKNRQFFYVNANGKCIKDCR